MKKIVIAFLLVISMVFLPAKVLSTKTVFLSERNSFTVCIDAGHGGIDGGAVGSCGIGESEINLDIAKKLKDIFTAHGIGVVLTRADSDGLYGLPTKGFKLRDLKNRVEIAERANADILISVHLNKYADSDRRGAQVFYEGADERSKALAESIQQSLNDMDGAPRKYTPLKGDYYILNETTMPAVICECGFLSNPEDEALLLTEDYRLSLADAIFAGVIDFFVTA